MAGIADVLTVQWDPSSASFDTGPSYTDITGVTESVTIQRGGTNEFGLYSAGRVEIVVNNNDGTIDPTVSYKWRQVLVTATASGPTTNYQFHGRIMNVRHDQSRAPFKALAVIEAEDWLGVLARYEFTGTDVPAEFTGERVGRVLTAIGMASGWYSVADGYVRMAEPSDGVLNVNALQHMQDATECEAGALYAARDGVLQFADRYWRLTNLASAASAVFSDAPSGSDVSILYGDLTLVPVGADYRNRVTFIPDSGVAQTASNVPADTPPDSLSRSLPMADDSVAAANAELLLDVLTQNVVWPAAVTVPMWPQNSTNFDVVTALELGDYVTVEFTPVGESQQTYKCFVDSITHTISPSRWTCRVGFSSADKWFNAWGDIEDYIELDDASFGKLGTGKLAP